jgi:integrase
MPAKPRNVGGHWYVEINHKGQSKKLTSWMNQGNFTEDNTVLISNMVNNQILSGHFAWDFWFPKLRKKYEWDEAYWSWFECKQRSPATRSNLKYKAQHFERLRKRDIRELRQADFLWIREEHGDTEKAKAIRTTAQAFLNWAWKGEMLERQVFLPPITPPKHKTPYLPLETRWAIHDHMKPPYQDPMLLGIEMGMRIGEICALQWGDIDWENEGINVCHTISAYQLKDSRKGGDEVWLPMTEKVKKMLMTKRSEKPSVSGFVFTHGSGKQVWTQQLSSKFKSACRLLGVPKSKFHFLRNSFLHDLSERGATTKEAGALAGHRSEKTTERYIGRWSKDKVRQIASLRGGRNETPD